MSGSSSLGTAVLVVFYIVVPILVVRWLKYKISGVRVFPITNESEEPQTPQPKRETSNDKK